MKVLLTGATGNIGRFTTSYLLGKGHSVTAMVRDPERALNLLGQGTHIIDYSQGQDRLIQELENTDAVINLSGSPVATRWTKSRKQELRYSRIDITKKLVSAISSCLKPPKMLISASAVGYYGNSGDKPLIESDKPGQGFLSQLCEDWEQAAMEAEQYGTRVCTLRIGIVLSREAGFLKSVLPTFEMGIGAYIGANQFIPWIHIHDMVYIIGKCLENDDIKGPINCVAPSQITNKELSREIADIVGTKYLMPIHPSMLKPLLGQATDVLTNSQRVIPQKLESLGHVFKFPSITEALKEELTPECIEITKCLNSNSRTSAKKPDIPSEGQYELHARIPLRSPQGKVFEFFSSAANLGLLTPRWVDFRILEMPDKMGVGSIIKYRIGLWFIGIKWTTKIIVWKPDDVFIDYQQSGPYSIWWHEHRIIPKSDGTVDMQDRVIYRLPFGALGRIAHRLLVRQTLLRIFRFRQSIIQLRIP